MKTQKEKLDCMQKEAPKIYKRPIKRRTGLALQGMLSPKARGTRVPTKVDSTPQPLPSPVFFLFLGIVMGLFVCIIHGN